jgi:hypothetical protein
MDTIVISFGHKMRHGKDTAIAAIVANRADKYDVRRYAFANPLKQEVNEGAEKAGGMEQFITQLRSTHNLPEWVTYDPNPDMSDPLCPLGKQRTLLQWWGTEYRRASDSYYWVKKLYRTIQTREASDCTHRRYAIQERVQLGSLARWSERESYPPRFR